MNNMEDIMNKIETIKKRLSQLQTELEKINVKGEDETTGIVVISNGKGHINDVIFPHEDIDREQKEGLVRAINESIEKSKQLKKEKKQEIVSDINIPDMPGLF